MVNLSDKEILKRDYLVERFGYAKDEFLKQYLIQFKEYHNYTEHNTIISILISELQLWDKKNFSLKSLNTSVISATDIASFTYCPVSYAISKTFEVPETERSVTGTSFHKEKRLIRYIKSFKIEKILNLLLVDQEIESAKYVEVPPLDYNKFIDASNKIFFDDLKNSEIVFVGHEEDSKERKYFKSKKGNYVGQPDYIFYNKVKKQFFAVEEKFMMSGRPQEKKETFYNNHKNQVRSYIFGINDFDISYGFLIYWKYYYADGNPNVYQCKTLRIEKNEVERKFLLQSFLLLQESIKKAGGHFDVENRNPQKCANCVNRTFCGHKTGQYQTYTIPYSTNYMSLKEVELPDELTDFSKLEVLNDFDNKWMIKGTIFESSKMRFAEKFSSILHECKFSISGLPQWIVKSNKLYLQQISLNLIARRTHINIYELANANTEIFADWISGEFLCWRKTNVYDYKLKKEEYELVQYNFNNGQLEKREIQSKKILVYL